MQNPDTKDIVIREVCGSTVMEYKQQTKPRKSKDITKKFLIFILEAERKKAPKLSFKKEEKRQASTDTA